MRTAFSAPFWGAAYVFVPVGALWTQQAKLTASDNAAGDDFGWSVAVSGTTAVVGAWVKNSSTGAAYVYVRSGTTTWTQQAKLAASDGAANDNFGISVALSGSTAIVGASGMNSSKGSAYVFVRSGAAWIQQTKLVASDGAAADYFGMSVAISGSRVLTGAYKNSATGAAYIYVLPSQQAELTASGGVAGDYFGVSLAMSGSTALVGDYGRMGSGGCVRIRAHRRELVTPGAAHSFRRCRRRSVWLFRGP